jgi:hypothetical protein
MKEEKAIYLSGQLSIEALPNYTHTILTFISEFASLLYYRRFIFRSKITTDQSHRVLLFYNSKK